jgi:hypothetical protein
MSGDVDRKLVSFWPDPAERQRAQADLSRYGMETHERETERVRLAILKLADGRLGRVRELVDAAKNDYRDVLMWAEYPGEGQALWALRADLSAEERQRLDQLRVQDRKQYREWLDK